ncbi:hypothetical protein B0H14DRAFT_3511051 [Mycena olivaceomarginata]|nr:hypothetical protein B0H14DRAFT_3511051 [Mycena olivaceomarginata]
MSALPSVSSVPDSPELETLIHSLQVIGRQVRLAQGSLSQLLSGRSVVAVEHHFVPGTPATPQEIAAAFANPKDSRELLGGHMRQGTRPLHQFDAKDQTNGVPNQHQLCCSNFNDALDYYANNYPHNVKKLVEVASPLRCCVRRVLRHRVALCRARRIALIALRVELSSDWVDVVSESAPVSVVVDDKTVSK